MIVRKIAIIALVEPGAGFSGTVALGRQEQGPIAKMVFSNATPAGWSEAFTFNMTLNGKTDFTMKNGKIVLSVPAQYIKYGRKFAILALDQNGMVHTYNDTDVSNSTVTVDINVAGYAFDLIYSDMS